MRIHSNTKKAKDERCRFLLALLVFSFALLFFLDIYIGYEIALQFASDGWSFLGGFMIAFSYVIAIPATILALLSIKKFKKGKNYKLVFPLILSISGILSSLILHNAFEYWVALLLFSILLLGTSLFCNRNVMAANRTNSGNEDVKAISKEEKSEALPSVFRIVKAIQIIGLVVVLLFTLGALVSDKLTILQKAIILFVAAFDTVVTLAFLKRKKWALTIELFGSYLLLGITIAFFVIFLITDGVSMTRSFFATLGFFVIIILIFIYLLFAYKKLKNTAIFVMLAFISVILIPSCSTGVSKNTGIEEIYLLDKNDFNPYVSFMSSDISDFFKPENTSKYPSVNLFDGFLKTCWIAGKSDSGTISSLYVKVPKTIDVSKAILNIFSGYGKSKKLYLANARPKDIKLSLYTGLYPEGFSTEVTSLNLIKLYATDTLVLADTFAVQSFPLNINREKFSEFQHKTLKECKTFSGTEFNKLKTSDHPKFTPSLILKIEVLSTYPGTKYKDVCISEIFFNNRFVTAYPDRYNTVDKVYIKNDNTLLTDYKDKKGVVIYKDTSCVFTMIDHLKQSNFAILHYVPNSSTGQGSRVEELYKLVDLKNKKVVEKEFEKYTGQPPLLMEKSNKGGIFITTYDDKYKIELK